MDGRSAGNSRAVSLASNGCLREKATKKISSSVNRTSRLSWFKEEDPQCGYQRLLSPDP